MPFYYLLLPYLSFPKWLALYAAQVCPCSVKLQHIASAGLWNLFIIIIYHSVCSCLINTGKRYIIGHDWFWEVHNDFMLSCLLTGSKTKSFYDAIVTVLAWYLIFSMCFQNQVTCVGIEMFERFFIGGRRPLPSTQTLTLKPKYKCLVAQLLKLL